MKRLIVCTIFALLILTNGAYAIGGQPQEDVECDPSTHRGVGLLHVQVPGQPTGKLGTFQILPQSEGLCCLTAAHVLENGADVVAEIGDVSIKVKEAYIHPTYDIAILKLPCSFPQVDEDDLPFLPTAFDWNSKVSFMGECVGYGCTSSDDTTHYGQITHNASTKRKGSLVIKKEREALLGWWRPYDHHSYVYVGSGDSGGPLIVDHMLVGMTISAHSNPEVLTKHVKLIGKSEHQRLQDLNAPRIATLSYGGHDAAYAYGDVIDSTVKIYINKDVVDVEEVIEFNSLVKFIHDEISSIHPSSRSNDFQFAQNIIDYLFCYYGASSGFERKSVFQSLEPCLPWIREHIQKK